MHKFDFNRFNTVELFQSPSGKTSASATVGILFSVVATLAFMLGGVELYLLSTTHLLQYATVLASLGAGMLGLRKVVNGSTSIDLENETSKEDELGQG